MNLIAAVTVYLKLPRSHDTARTYTSNLLRLADYIGHDRDVVTITFEELVDYIYAFQHLKPGTVYGYTVMLKTFFKWCVRVGYIPTSPAALLPLHKAPRDLNEDRAIPAHILDKMLKQVRSKATFLAVRDYAILRFFDDTGCRRKAVSGLRVRFLHLDTMEAHVVEKGGDTVILYFGTETRRALMSWLAIRPTTRHDFVFVARLPSQDYPPMKPSSISQMVRRASQSAGGNNGPHSIRHFVAHELFEEYDESPETIRRKLNHKNIATTERYLPRHSRRVKTITLMRAERRSGSHIPNPRIIPLDDDSASDSG